MGQTLLYNKYDKYVIAVVMNVHLPATSGFVRVPAFWRILHTVPWNRVFAVDMISSTQMLDFNILLALSYVI